MKDKKNSVLDALKLLGGLIPTAIMLLYIFFSDKHDEKIMQEQGVDTECVLVAYGEGSMGIKSPTKGYHNQFAYYIDSTIHYCYVFTSEKPLPDSTKLKVRYLLRKDGKVTINFPDEYKEEYKEYGFDNYYP